MKDESWRRMSLRMALSHEGGCKDASESGGDDGEDDGVFVCESGCRDGSEDCDDDDGCDEDGDKIE